MGIRCAEWRKGSPGASPSRPQAQVCKLPELGMGAPAPPPPPQPSAALAAAEPGLLANVLAPSEQDQCLGRKCGQSPVCTLHPHSTITVVPLGPGRAGTLGLAGGGLGSHCLLWATPTPACGLNGVRTLKGRSEGHRPRPDSWWGTQVPREPKTALWEGFKEPTPQQPPLLLSGS